MCKMIGRFFWRRLKVFKSRVFNVIRKRFGSLTSAGNCGKKIFELNFVNFMEGSLKVVLELSFF